jgi:hypothetical protein
MEGATSCAGAMGPNGGGFAELGGTLEVDNPESGGAPEGGVPKYVLIMSGVSSARHTRILH